MGGKTELLVAGEMGGKTELLVAGELGGPELSQTSSETHETHTSTNCLVKGKDRSLRAQILAVPRTNWETVGKSFYLFESHFLICE